jgi:hypothetical protein
MTDREEKWWQKVSEVLGDCTCDDAYKSRHLIAPDCIWCHAGQELFDALEGAYRLGRYDQRHGIEP